MSAAHTLLGGWWTVQEWWGVDPGLRQGSICSLNEDTSLPKEEGPDSVR